MIIAARTLRSVRSGKDVDIDVRIHMPEQDRAGWVCKFEIDWPEGEAARWGSGVDAVQALVHALQMIGAEIYTSRYHKEGWLEWLARNRGYGFPVTNNVRDLLIGDDEKFL